MGDLLGKAKKAAQGFMKFVKKIVDMVKFFMTYVGWVVAIIILVIFLIIALAVLIRTMEHALGKWLDADYAGISTEGDYEYLVSSLGYAGYDSMVTEKVWQEFMAYEYAVLMDVAEFIYVGQEAYYGDPNNVKGAYGPYSQFFYDDTSTSDRGAGEPTTTNPITGEKVVGPVYMPYLKVIGEYDISKMSFEDWQNCVIEGQGSARFGITSVGALQSSPGVATQIVTYGGNMDVQPPTLVYEYKTNPYEPNGKGSLVPYITVLKEQLKYYYYTVGGRSTFVNGPKNDKNGGVLIDQGNIHLVNLMEVSNLLNAGNPFLPKSSALTEQIAQDPSMDPLGNQDAWPVADTAFPQDLYFTNDYGSVTYKTALQIMIDRYLPKASILTAWYYVKDTDLASSETQGKEVEDNELIANRFNVDQLMKDIKAIYNLYCLGTESKGETLEDEVIDAIVYNSGDGTVYRPEGQGTPAATYESTQRVAKTNDYTFIHFGQAGLETNKFGVFNVYHKDGSTVKPTAPESITGDPEEVTVPVTTDLLAKDAHFLDRFGLDATYNYDYEFRYQTYTEPEKVYYDYIQGGRYKTLIITASHVSHVTTSGTFSVTNDTCGVCQAKYSGYEGWIIKARENFSSGSGKTGYVLLDPNSDIEASPPIRKYFTVTPGGWSDWIYEEDNANDDLFIPYEAAKDAGGEVVEPRGLVAIPNGDPISEHILEHIINEAEVTFMDNHQELKDAASYTIEHQEKSAVNHEYLYPKRTIKSASDPDSPAAEVLTFYDDYDHKKAFYNFAACSGNSVDPDDVRQWLDDEIENLASTALDFDTARPTGGDSVFFGLFSEWITNDDTYPDPRPIPDIVASADPDKIKYEFLDIKRINSVDVHGYANDSEYNTPEYAQVYSSQKSPYNAIFDIDEYQIALILDIKQKRIATMIVTDVETWAKSATYSIEIIQNSFDYTNYRYVVPHSYFSFGVRVFNIDQNPIYRVEYYKDYFSRYENREPGIKEADVLTMMMKWEEYAKSGNDTAYAFMRDLYKLIMYIRQTGIDNENNEDYILSTAYSYLYIPDTIWEFREGIAQEAFWTERLASELYGDDAMTQEELNRVRVKKDEISWQIVDYDEYPECQYTENGENKAKVYALFPFGAAYTRTWFMEDALEKGKFYDGNYMEGHGGADWTSRAKMSAMLSGSEDLAVRIYEYELRSRTLRNIMGGNEKLEYKIDQALDFIGGTSDGGTAYTKAEAELRKELREYEVNSPEVAVVGGVVYKADYNCYSGFSVGVTHTKEDAATQARTSYVHMRRWPSVQMGDIVGPGTVLGYEGTTGNSGGNHLHQNVNIGGEKDSPSEYMGPIFAPFYNNDKIIEVLSTFAPFSANQELLLGTDYYTLTRTVLMQKFTGGRAEYEVSLPISPQEQTSFLKTASVVLRSGDNGVVHQYINFYSGNDEFDELGNPLGGSSGIASGDGKVIIKVGASDPKYYLCEYVPEVVSSHSVSDDSLSGDDYLSSRGNVMLRIISSGEIDNFSETVLNNSIKVEIDVDIDGTTQVVWGNNVPYSPLVKDMADVVDITSLELEKIFDPTKFASEYNGTPNDPAEGEGSGDIKASKNFFDPEMAKDKIKVPSWLLMYLSDVESAFSVPFYDAAVSMAHQNAGIQLGYAGSVSGDLQKLQEAIRMKGFDPQKELVMSGEYDAITERIVRTYVAPGVGNSNYTAGRVGKYTSTTSFDIEGVSVWNAYVTFGSEDAAIEAGKMAAEYGASVNGQNPLFVKGVASCESSFLPTNESHQFCSGTTSISWVDTPAYPTETLNLEEAKGTIEYRGVQRTLRRAQGLMQLAPGVGLSRARRKVGDDINQIVAMIRSPRGNATLGAEYLAENKQRIMTNADNNYTNLKNNVKGNAAFAAMEKYSGIDAMDIALSACSAYMYNKGPNGGGEDTPDNTQKIIEAMKHVTFDPNRTPKVQYDGSVGIDIGYTDKVMTYMMDHATKVDSSQAYTY